jgi:hypothetical protein
MIDRASPRPPASTMTESSLSDNTLDTSPDSGAVGVCDEKSGSVSLSPIRLFHSHRYPSQGISHSIHCGTFRRCAAEDAEGKSALAAMPPLPALEEENTLAGCLQSEMEGERHDDEDIRCLPLSYIPYFRRKPLVRRYIWGATVGLVMVLVVAGFVGGT